MNLIVKELLVNTQLTNEEKIILRNIDFKYIVRNGDGDLWVSNFAPIKEDDEWVLPDHAYDYEGIRYRDLSVFNHLFQMVNFIDDEPALIEELIGD